MSDPAVGRIGWAVTSDGTCVEMCCSPGVSAAYDILIDAGYSPQKAADCATSFERHGYDPEQMARKMVRMAKAIGGPR